LELWEKTLSIYKWEYIYEKELGILTDNGRERRQIDEKKKEICKKNCRKNFL
jgi:hypothetical protein